ncbi:alpha/beta hydrolase [Reyranella sp. CPCC 100927]|uniref:alpha/beta hydrolase n=1 Tax=Reyranella sp. CPCC 100927 TaxID=2599616 RepID=UPI0015B60429|nr:alpha/beta hydrolase [Reyranella sp. CPCC 100927]
MRALSWLTVLAAMLTTPGYARAEAVQLQHDGRTLNADLTLPAGGDISGGLVVLVHGTLMHGRMEIMAALQKGLAERGVGSLAITLSLGLNDRRGPYDCATPHRHMLDDTAREIGAWTQWAKERGAARVDLAGHSRGGAQVAYALANHTVSGVRRVVLIAPAVSEPGEVATGYEKTYGIPLAALLAGAITRSAAPDTLLRPIGFLTCRDAAVAPRTFLDNYTGLSRHDTPTLLARIGDPTLVVIAGNDEVVRGLDRRLPPASDRLRIVTVDGADHQFLDLYGEDLAEAVATFIKE